MQWQNERRRLLCVLLGIYFALIHIKNDKQNAYSNFMLNMPFCALLYFQKYWSRAEFVYEPNAPITKR